MNPEEAAEFAERLSRFLDAVNEEIDQRGLLKGTVFENVDRDIRETLVFVQAIANGHIMLPPATVTGP